MTDQMHVAMLHEVFFGDDAEQRLTARLQEARAAGAELAVLPELPMQTWCAAERTPANEDAEPPEGPRHRIMAAAARAAGVGLVGGAIVRDPDTGLRFNTALVFAADGTLVDTYRKCHIPEEPGFWESDHYEPGNAPPRVIEGFGLPFGVQICSDTNRPFGTHLLAASGAALVVIPRSTEAATYERWRLVLRANALVSACHVICVNRPGPEFGVLIGGPSVAVSPQGEVVAESEDPVTVVAVDRAPVEAARRGYPGYLTWHRDLYVEGWGGA